MNSGNGRPHQQARTDTETSMLEQAMQQLMEANRQNQQLIAELFELRKHGNRDSLIKRIKNSPYKGRKWNSKSEYDMSVQLTEFILDVDRHISVAWEEDPEDTHVDENGKMMKAVEAFIGDTPRRAWYDSWIGTQRQKGKAPTWGSFKIDAKERFLKGATYKLRQIQELLKEQKLQGDAFNFNSDFRTKMARLPEDISLEDVVKARYLLNLPKEMAATLTLFQPDKSIDEWMNTVEETHTKSGTKKGGNPDVQKKSKAETRKAVVHCFRCGADHYASKCPASDEAVARHQKDCARCKKRAEKKDRA